MEWGFHHYQTEKTGNPLFVEALCKLYQEHVLTSSRDIFRWKVPRQEVVERYFFVRMVFVKEKLFVKILREAVLRQKMFRDEVLLLENNLQEISMITFFFA
jgi:hypothetical protein